MTRYIIDSDQYGVRTEFESLAEAQSVLRACDGTDGEWDRITLRVVVEDHASVILNERDQRVGEVLP